MNSWYYCLSLSVTALLWCFCSSKAAKQPAYANSTSYSSSKTGKTDKLTCPAFLQPFFSSLLKDTTDTPASAVDNRAKEQEDSCFSNLYWKQLQEKEGEAAVNAKSEEFFNRYFAPWAELQRTHPESCLADSMVELAFHDPLVKAIIANDNERVRELCKSGAVQLNDVLDLPFTSIKANYLAIAFFVANSDQAGSNPYRAFRQLLACGANPNSALYFNDQQLPLILLAMALADKMALVLLIDHGATLDVSFAGHTPKQVAQAFESTFNCKGYLSFLERYSENHKHQIDAAQPQLAIADIPFGYGSEKQAEQVIVEILKED